MEALLDKGAGRRARKLRRARTTREAPFIPHQKTRRGCGETRGVRQDLREDDDGLRLLDPQGQGF